MLEMLSLAPSHAKVRVTRHLSSERQEILATPGLRPAFGGAFGKVSGGCPKDFWAGCLPSDRGWRLYNEFRWACLKGEPSREFRRTMKSPLLGGRACSQLEYESGFFPGGGPSPLTNPYGRGIIDPDTSRMGLQVEIAVEDPVMLNATWSGLVTYRPVLGVWPEAICAENTRELGA